MKRRIAVCKGLAWAVLAACVARGESEITVDYGSAYIWRGQVLNSAAVVQPGMTVTTPVGVWLNAWGNMDATKKNELAGKFNEVDLTAAYTLPLEGPAAVDIGAINYLFPYHSEQGDGALDETSELFASLGLDVLLAPTLAVYYDIDEINGAYVNAGVGHSYAATEQVSLDAGLSVGWGSSKYNGGYFAEESSKFNDAKVSLGTTVAITEALSLGASVAYSYLLDSTIRDQAEEIYGQKDNAYAGVKLAYAF